MKPRKDDSLCLLNGVKNQGRIQDFKLGGGADLKKLRRAEGGAETFGVFRVKNHMFSNFRVGPILGGIRPCV
jgi:hypothetical protein